MKIIYTETQKTFSRKILACSGESRKRFGIENGEEVLVNDSDIFSIKLENKKIDCIMDSDILANARLLETIREKKYLAVNKSYYIWV